MLGEQLRPSPLEIFCPHIPWPKQRAFLDLDCQEAFYGGAAAGGKSDALLMAALQYVDVPGYAALILRRDTRRLTLSGGLIPRSHSWLAGKGPTWNGTDRRWTFPTSGDPATISFGYLQDSYDKFRYGSSEYQFIAFDELTEFPEDDYLFLFSRLRRTRNIAVPLRMRSASNPGNLGHAWVKRRFVVENSPHAESDIHWRNEIAYVPARLVDNPAVDAEQYVKSLYHLPLVERQRLMEGDWSIRADGMVRLDWLRSYETQGNSLRLLDPRGKVIGVIHERECRRFVTIDPAGTSAERAQELRGRPPCWTALMVWDQPRGAHGEMLLLREVRRARVGFAELCQLIRDCNNRWRPKKILIEREKLGQAAVDTLSRELPIETISTEGRDKVTRAAPLLVKLERGEIWLPQLAPWRAAFEGELLGWTGLPHETCDQIDAAAYAVREAEIHRETTVIEPIFGRR